MTVSEEMEGWSHPIEVSNPPKTGHPLEVQSDGIQSPEPVAVAQEQPLIANEETDTMLEAIASDFRRATYGITWGITKSRQAGMLIAQPLALSRTRDGRRALEDLEAHLEDSPNIYQLIENTRQVIYFRMVNKS